MLGQLLGADPTVEGVAALIAARAAGNPFFAEEMVRELAERGVLTGDRGGYICGSALAELSVPATLQATIAARIDRLHLAAKRTVSAAAVIGSRFGPDLLTSLGIDVALDEPIMAELIDQVEFTPSAVVCVPASFGTHGGLRIAAEIRPRRDAPPSGRRDRGE